MRRMTARLGRGPQSGAAARVRRGTGGQALTETLIGLVFLMTVIFALIQLALLVSTKHIVNYAAFAGARAGMYGRSSPELRGMDDDAMNAVIRMMNWGRPPFSFNVYFRDGYAVRYPTPLAMPIFNEGGLVMVDSIAPVPQQPGIPEEGDNAAP